LHQIFLLNFRKVWFILFQQILLLFFLFFHILCKYIYFFFFVGKVKIKQYLFILFPVLCFVLILPLFLRIDPFLRTHPVLHFLSHIFVGNQYLATSDLVDLVLKRCKVQNIRLIDSWSHVNLVQTDINLIIHLLIDLTIKLGYLYLVLHIFRLLVHIVIETIIIFFFVVVIIHLFQLFHYIFFIQLFIFKIDLLLLVLAHNVALFLANPVLLHLFFPHIIHVNSIFCKPVPEILKIIRDSQIGQLKRNLVLKNICKTVQFFGLVLILFFYLHFSWPFCITSGQIDI